MFTNTSIKGSDLEFYLFAMIRTHRSLGVAPEVRAALQHSAQLVQEDRHIAAHSGGQYSAPDAIPLTPTGGRRVFMSWLQLCVAG